MNHAADPIVTRLHPQTNQLQLVAINADQDTGEWALPGGFVDAGEHVSITVKREFEEEAGAITDDPEKLAEFNQHVDELFSGGRVVYKGYVDDPRTTDNAWIETDRLPLPLPARDCQNRSTCKAAMMRARPRGSMSARRASCATPICTRRTASGSTVWLRRLRLTRRRARINSTIRRIRRSPAHTRSASMS